MGVWLVYDKERQIVAKTDSLSDATTVAADDADWTATAELTDARDTWRRTFGAGRRRTFGAGR